MLQSKRTACAMAMLLISFAVTGCETMTKSETAQPDFCATSQPIFDSKVDVISDATARAILQHNLTGRKLCGW
jgi:hypothetical protein